MALQCLKILPEYFEAVKSGKKSFEIRKNDRDYREGDLLHLKEWTKEVGFTGRDLTVEVEYILENEDYLQPGYVCMAISKDWGKESRRDERHRRVDRKI